MAEPLLLALEGGGTRSQVALMNGNGQVLSQVDSTAVNTNFLPLEEARRVVLAAAGGVLQAAGMDAARVTHFAICLVGAQFGAETFGGLFPNAQFYHFPEMRVVFARAGTYRPHGVSLVAATGATTWGVRADDGREVVLGGWGSLLGDEGSAYAVGLQGLRGAVRAYEQRAALPTELTAALCSHFQLSLENFREELIRLVYLKPLSRTEIAGAAPLVTRLAQQGDPLAGRIVAKAAADLAALVLSAAGRLFAAPETFEVVLAGGMVNAGALLLDPLRDRLLAAYPNLNFKIGSEAPAPALGRLLLNQLEEKAC